MRPAPTPPPRPSPSTRSTWALDDLRGLRRGGRRAAPVRRGPRSAGAAGAPAPACAGHDVRALKQRALDRAFAHFRDRRVAAGSTVRRKALERVRRAAPRLAATTTPCSRRCTTATRRPGGTGPSRCRPAQPEALAAARAELADADPASAAGCSGSWTSSGTGRAPRPGRLGVALKGDLPFMVGGDSADVWSRRGDFRLDRRVGTPPDAFSADRPGLGAAAPTTGTSSASNQLRLAARPGPPGRGAVRPLPGRPRHRPLPDLDPPGELQPREPHRPTHGDHGQPRRQRQCNDGNDAAVDDDPRRQLHPGRERSRSRSARPCVGIFKRYGEVVAEDLGMVPEFLRPSLTRGWASPATGCCAGRRTATASSAIPPAGRRCRWPPTAPTTSSPTPSGGTPCHPRSGAAAGTSRAGQRRPGPGAGFDDQVRDALLQVVYDAPSALTINPLQDLLGTRGAGERARDGGRHQLELPDAHGPGGAGRRSPDSASGWRPGRERGAEHRRGLRNGRSSAER